MREAWLRVQIKNQFTELGPLAERVEAFCEQHNVPGKITYELSVALEELITNTIKFGFLDAAEHGINLELRLDPAGLLVQIEDDARPFNPLTIPAPPIDQPIEEREIGGLGIYLVRKLMDEVEYERRDGRNCVRLRKHIPVPRAP